MIVDCAIYHEGRRRPEPVADLSDALDLARTDAGDFVWLGLFEPTAEEFAEVADEFGLHPLAVEDAVHAHQRPKLETYGDSIFIVLKTIRYDDATEAIETGELMLFVGEAFVVSVRHGEGNPLSDVRQQLERNDSLLRCGPGAVVHAVCDRVVDAYTVVAAELQVDIDEVEVQVFSPERTNDAERIYKLKREVLEFRRAVAPLALPTERLAVATFAPIHPETRPFFRDVHDHVLRVAEQVEEFDSLLTSALDASLTQVSVQQNDDMRKISAWVAIAAVPTMLAGIWGMNFQHMPELGWRYGYPSALAVMIVSALVLFRLFKRSGWL